MQNWERNLKTIKFWLFEPKDLKSLKAQISNAYNQVLASIIEVLLTSTKALKKLSDKSKREARQNLSEKT